MSKRIAYALSLPDLPAAPTPEAGRTVLYASGGQLQFRQADGSNTPLGAQVYVQATQPASIGAPFMWWQTLPGGDLTLWIEDGL